MRKLLQDAVHNPYYKMRRLLQHAAEHTLTLIDVYVVSYSVLK